LVNGRVIIFDELVTEDMGTVRFAELLKQKMFKYEGFQFEVFGDPAGSQRSQVDERTPFQILHNNGIAARPAPTNDFMVRTESVNGIFSKLIDGQPAMTISSNCKNLRKACNGGYCFKRIQVSGDERYKDAPDKNKYSHIAEALGYALCGMGEGKKLLVNTLREEERKKNLKQENYYDQMEKQYNLT
jgi:hypothetical protein